MIRLAISASSAVEAGVVSDGLRTTLLPAACGIENCSPLFRLIPQPTSLYATVFRIQVTGAR
jgi:hypothetical protein